MSKPCDSELRNILEQRHLVLVKATSLIKLGFFFVLGFFDRREFVITQHPMENTMYSFWQMVFEQDVHLIVTLTSIDSQECLPFWPSCGQVGQTLEWVTPGQKQKIKVVLLEEIDAPSRRAIRISLEVGI